MKDNERACKLFFTKCKYTSVQVDRARRLDMGQVIGHRHAQQRRRAAAAVSARVRRPSNGGVGFPAAAVSRVPVAAAPLLAIAEPHQTEILAPQGVKQRNS